MENGVQGPHPTIGKQGVSLLPNPSASQASTDAESQLGELGLPKGD